MLTELPIKPGVIKDNSALLSEGRWIDADKMRFRSVGGKSHPEVIGGFEDLTEQTFLGKCRALHAWENLSGEVQLAAGTHTNAYVFSQGLLWDITPVRDASTLTNALDTLDTQTTVTVNHASHGVDDGAVVYLHNSSAVGGLSLGTSGSLSASSIQTSVGSKVLIVTDAAHGLADQDRVTYAGATTVGGVPSVEINTTHTVVVLDADTYALSVATAATSDAAGGGTPTFTGLKAYAATFVDANSYTVEAASAATSTASGGGGALTYEYAINPGRENTAAQAGYSTGTYSGGSYSLPSSESDLRARVWVFSNFGEDLVANYRGSVLYRWQNVPSQKMAAIGATDAPQSNISHTVTLEHLLVELGTEEATGATDAPQSNISHMVTPERFLMALGTEEATGSTFDPLQIAWAKIEGGFANGDWTPTAENSAGDLKLAEGSRIVAGTAMPNVSVIWTDTALYGLQYIPDIDVVYRPELLGTGCGLIGPNAYARAGDSGQVYWLSTSREFMVWQGGTPLTVDCPVRDFFFDGLAELQEDLIYAGVNDKFNEVWWFYPDSTNENARYVAFNYSELHWTIGTFPITAWQPRGVNEFPVAAHSDGTLKLHEKGNSDNGAAFSAHIESAFMDIAEGETHLNVRRFEPDFDGLSGSVQLTLKHRLWPQGAETTTVAGTVTATTEKLDFRITAKQLGVRMDWTASPTDGRVGRLMFDISPTGRKR